MKRTLKKPFQNALIGIAFLCTTMLATLNTFSMKAIPAIIAMLMLDVAAIYLLAKYGKGLTDEK